MKRTYALLLLVSLAFNAVLTFIIFRTQKAQYIGNLAKSNFTEKRGAWGRPETTDSDNASQVATKATLSSPRDVARRMQQDGYPNIVIYQAVLAAVRKRDSMERAKLEGRANAARWQKAIRLSPEAVEGLRTLEARQRAELQSLVGTPEEFADSMTANERKKYGSLSAHKIAAVQRIEQEYNDIARNSPTDGFQPPSVVAKITAEKEADLAKILTPGELDDFIAYNSPASSLLKMQLAPLTSSQVDDAMFVALARITNAAEGQKIAAAGDASKLWAIDSQLYSFYRDKLGDDNFLSISTRLNPAASSADAVYRAANITPAHRGDLFLQAHRAYLDVQVGGRSDVAADAYRSLTDGAGLTSQQRSAFDQTPIGALLKRASGAR